jgi:hypothetical protein
MDWWFGSLWDEVDSRESGVISIGFLLSSSEDEEKLKGEC